MRRLQIVVAGETFRSQKDFAIRLRGILSDHQVGDYLNGQEFLFVAEAIYRHPRAKEKIGAGIARLKVTNPRFLNAKGFFIERIDGTTTDFSIKKCIRPASALREDITDAFRNSIEDQISLAYSKAFEGGPFPCPLTNELLIKGDGNSHVHHVPPWTFQKILEDFLQMSNLQLLDVKTSGHGDGEVKRSIADLDLDSRWKVHHQERAVLQILSKRGHLSVLPKLKTAELSGLVESEPIDGRSALSRDGTR